MKTSIRERIEAYIHYPGTEEPMCANCAHYHPHYREDGHPLHCGHCCYPRTKPRKAYDLCEHFKDKKERPAG